MWDGKIRLFHLMRGTIYYGLIDSIRQFAKDRGYQIEYDTLSDFGEEIFPLAAAQQHINDLELPFAPREYQIDAFAHAIRKRRALLISPTASGKSLIIYLIATYLLTQMDKRVLIVVPTLNLVHQMASDFIDYGCPPELIHKIYAGQSKDIETHIVITTWQSIYQLPTKWYDQYGAVVGDEAHSFKAKSLIEMMEKTTKLEYKVGTTGTLDGTQTNKLVLEGLFGPVKQVTTTAKLMEESTVAQLKIKAIVLNYPEEVHRLFAKSKPSYKDEISYLTTNVQRNKFLCNLATSLKQNTLLLFQFVQHGKEIHNMLTQMNPDRIVRIVYGGVEGEEREEIRKLAEKNDNVIIVASYKTFSTGVNIKNLHNIISGSPSKSRIRVLQSIGRALRKNETKEDATMYDIADDISWKSYRNHTLKHLHERIDMYNQEKFDYKMFMINLKGAS